MKLRAVFQNGSCRLFMEPEDKWEKKLIGSIAKGGDRLEAVVIYKPSGHFSYGEAELVEILLQVPTNDPQDPHP